MSDLFFCMRYNPEYHHRRSVRKHGYDYGSPGWYFITICAKDRQHYFGKITNNQMKLSSLGQIVKRCWHEIPRHFNQVALDAFMVMPDHVHGIIVIKNTIKTAVGSQNFATLQNTMLQHNPIAQFGPQSKNLASIIRGFKIGITKYATSHNMGPIWQSRYYDRIIRDTNELERIRWYILNNSRMWRWDKNNQQEI